MAHGQQTTKTTFEVEAEFKYDTTSRAGALNQFWQDVPESLGASFAHSVEIRDIEKNNGAETFTLTIRATFEESENDPEEVFRELAHFYSSEVPRNGENSFHHGHLEASAVLFTRCRRAHSPEWVTGQTEVSYTVHASGEEIEIPEEVDVLRDPYMVPNNDDYGGNPFAEWMRQEDFHSSAWWAFIRPNPGSADEDYSGFYEDEAAAVRRAIRLAEAHDVPLLIR